MFSGLGYWVFSGRSWKLPVFCEDLVGSLVPKTRVEPALIIEQLDPPDNLFPGHLTGWELFPVDQFTLEEPVRRFRQRVVATTPGPPDRTRQSKARKHRSVFIGGIVTAPITMRYSTFRNIDIAGRHLDRL